MTLLNDTILNKGKHDELNNLNVTKIVFNRMNAPLVTPERQGNEWFIAS